MYRCSICKDTVGPRQPRLLHVLHSDVWNGNARASDNSDGNGRGRWVKQIAQEIPVCQECSRELVRASRLGADNPLATVRKMRGKPTQIGAPIPPPGPICAKGQPPRPAPKLRPVQVPTEPVPIAPPPKPKTAAPLRAPLSRPVELEDAGIGENFLNCSLPDVEESDDGKNRPRSRGKKKIPPDGKK